MEDKKLLKKLRKGDTAAYRYLFSTYYTWLCNYVLKLCNDPSLAEDIVQETMVNFWEKRDSILITTSLKSYLFRSCHNQFLQHIRKQKIKFDFLDNIRWEVIASAQEEYNTTRDRDLEKLNSLIDKLPPRCKEIFIKNKIQKQKYKDIAVDMGISIKTVENQMSKALHFLKENANSFLL
ncbi:MULTISPECIES: RNA polymerase sigma-70 factor [unclassified Leeuwenhoekiella]|uniref:RNA polymerase sigma-70 factor n=1 Tax=unclassified Leeuwenhoekiella TaxID=2615029 RepID=UPI000C3FD955|nr:MULTISPECIES: RNA polymerase sigma-70 factor [unclassified Leeuwenhoekiella]MAW93709.1 RNA polymerase sigma-70 factor [Leeuwenhoekiella sp.]MBA83067.1 RNA polymerase sigma-70 factor [Leeuwenhoekiella sp.]|tara:strand:+ start:40090 stop:40626 length:537 start_codon:yes stop_codon:yes gene_type:complete